MKNVYRECCMLGESKARCPKCKSKDLTLKEYWVSTIEFEQEDGMLSEEGSMDHEGPFKLRGMCSKCGYLWTLKASQVTQVVVTRKEDARQ